MTAAPTDGVLDWMDKYTAKEEKTEATDDTIKKAKGEYLTPDRGGLYMEAPIYGGCQGFKCGDFTMRPGGLLDSMPEGWKLSNG